MVNSYTNTFTGNPVQTTPTNFRAFTIGSSTALSWPLVNEDTGNVAADVMEVTASVASLNLLMPPANQASIGKGTTIRNMGANTFTVTDQGGNTIIAIAAGQTWWVYPSSNSTANGTWHNFQYGTGTSSADANSLAGLGLLAIATTLNENWPVTSYNSNHQYITSDRSQISVWTGGAGAWTFQAASVLGNGWFTTFKNLGSGSVTFTPTGPNTIDTVASLTLNPNESCIIGCDGVNFYSFMKSTAGAIVFTRLVKSVAGAANVTLTTAEAGFDIQEYTGILTGNISVIVPTQVSRWWVYNNTTGAFTLTVKTAAGTGIAVTQGTRLILHCDGTNVQRSVDTTSGTVTSIIAGTGLSGGTITTSGTIAIASTTVAAGTYGTTATGFTTFTSNAQGQLTSAGAFGDVSSSILRIVDSADATKKLAVNLAGLTTATTRTWALPDASSTFTGTDATQTLTNKSISGATNTITNVSLTTGVTGILPAANGGTGLATLTANNVMLGNGVGVVQFVAPSTSGNILTSNGTTWQSSVQASGITVGTPRQPTSGTSDLLTGLPSICKRVTTTFNILTKGGGGGNDDWLIRIGPSGGVATSGYNSSSYRGGATNASSSSGIYINSTASIAISGSIVLTLVNSSSNMWSYFGIVTAGSASTTVSGSVSISGALERISIEGQGGTTAGTFAGNVGTWNTLVE